MRMALSPMIVGVFLAYVGCFFSGLIVLVCCCLYAIAYPKSPEAGSLSSIALGTLAFSILSTIITLVLLLRQKSGKSIYVMFENIWLIFAAIMWALAAVGGIIRPPNGMANVTCKILPDGTETDDAYFKRACQAMFASTAFCIVTALCFLAVAAFRLFSSAKRSVHNHKTKNDQVGGHYQLSMTLSQYRRTEKEAEEGKKLKGAGEHEEEEEDITLSGQLSDGNFSDRVYQDPAVAPTTSASNSNHEAFEQPNAHLTFLQQQQYQVHHQLQQQHQQQLQQQQHQDHHQSHYM